METVTCSGCEMDLDNCICESISAVLRSFQKVVYLNWQPVTELDNVIFVDFKNKKRIA